MPCLLVSAVRSRLRRPSLQSDFSMNTAATSWWSKLSGELPWLRSSSNTARPSSGTTRYSFAMPNLSRLPLFMIKWVPNVTGSINKYGKSMGTPLYLLWFLPKYEGQTVSSSWLSSSALQGKLLILLAVSEFSSFSFSQSEVLRGLSSMHRLVVATGGGAVIRPINWYPWPGSTILPLGFPQRSEALTPPAWNNSRNYMKKGITVWLDVPLEALARRIAAVGTDSRPLLHHESGDPYKKVSTHSASSAFLAIPLVE